MAKVSKVIILREAITKVTQILTGKRIKVIQRGMEAKVAYDTRTKQPIAVYLPMLPDDASDELCDAIQGFLDHEVAHILFSDPDALVPAQKLGEEGRAINNMVEDAFIERKMAAAFKGCGSNLATVGSFYLKNYVTPRVEAARAKGDQMAELNVLFPTIIRALSGQFIFKEALAHFKSEAADAVFKKLEALSPKLEAIENSMEGIEVTKEILKELKKDQPPPPPKGQPSKNKDESDEEEESDGQEGQGEGKSDPDDEQESSGEDDKSSKGDKDENDPEEESESDGQQGGAGEGDDKSDEEEEQEPGEQDGSGGDSEQGEDPEETEESEGGTEEESEGDQGGGKAAEQGEGEEEQEAGQSPSTPVGEGDDTEDDAHQGDKEENTTEEQGHGGGAPEEEQEGNLTWEEIAEAMKGVQNFDEAAAETVAALALASVNVGDYIPFTTEADRIEILQVPDSERESSINNCNRVIEGPVASMVNPMQKELERAMAARAAAVFVGGHRSGRLHGASLTRLQFNDDRVFRRKEENLSKDVEVSLVIDISGSMSGSKVLTAARAAFALSSVLERIRIKNEIICFTTGADQMTPADRADAEAKNMSYARTESIIMPIVKSFDEPLNSDVRARLGYLPTNVAMNCNIDGESIEYAGRRLLKRRASRHVMIVLSDGYPAGSGFYPGSTRFSGASRGVLNADLKNRVLRLEAAGVDVVAIGIEDDAPKNFYRKAVCLHDVNQLPTTVIKELRNLLIPK